MELQKSKTCFWRWISRRFSKSSSIIQSNSPPGEEFNWIIEFQNLFQNCFQNHYLPGAILLNYWKSISKSYWDGYCWKDMCQLPSLYYWKIFFKKILKKIFKMSIELQHSKKRFWVWISIRFWKIISIIQLNSSPALYVERPCHPKVPLWLSRPMLSRTVDLVPTVSAAGRPLLWLATAQAGWWNIPKLSQQ